jgi:hypothetical protein
MAAWIAHHQDLICHNTVNNSLSISYRCGILYGIKITLEKYSLSS